MYEKKRTFGRFCKKKIKKRMNNKFISVYAVVTTAALAYFGYAFTRNNPKNIATSLSTLGGTKEYIIRPFSLDKAFSFCGETVPMDNFDARERLDRELQVNAYMQASTISHVKLATRYFPTIEKILAEQGMHDDIKYLAVAESALRNVGSPAGAKGIWQFMSPVARQYGLEVNDEIDERFNLEKATVAACHLLKDNYKGASNSWLLAAAAYNEGLPRLRKEMSEQRASSYYDTHLNEETSRYVSRIVALKEIMLHPADYNFDIPSAEMYPELNEYSTIEVNTVVPNWGDFAQKYGISYRKLRLYNPWIIGTALTKPSKTYVVRLPKR